MNQYDFDKLLEKYLSGESTPQEEKLIQEWSDQIVKQSGLSLPPAEQKTIRKRIWQRVYHNTFGEKLFKTGPSGWHKLSIAAAVLIALTGTGYLLTTSALYGHFTAAVTKAPGDLQVNNTSEKPRSITLEDGSTVVLEPQSTISYPEHFGKKTRNVFLKGEAFFRVKKNSAQPFVVHTGDLVTQVLGTSFRVKSYEDAETIEVLVATGKVSVYEKADKPAASYNGAILTPNQKITFHKVSQKMDLGLVETPAMVQLPATKLRLVFTEAPLSQVFSTLSKTYGVEIVTENPALNTLLFTGDINDLPLYTQLNLICKSVNAKYQRRGTTLFIQGVGCQK